MREINFRGYSKRELTTPTQWLTDGYGVSKIEYTDGTSSVHLLTPYGDYWIDENSVGQYTGLTDKNNIRIYEGDIVEIESGTRYKVVFHRGCFKVQNIEHLQSNLYLLGEYDLEYLRVVGNIYEETI